MIYLSGHHSPQTVAAGLGLLAQPRTGYDRHIGAYPVWAADNGCFGKGFNLRSWKAWLERMSPHQGTCLFATAPDVLGDPLRTQARADRLLRYVRHLGYPAALAAQDGLEDSEFRCNCGADKAERAWQGRVGRTHVDGIAFCIACDQPAGYDVRIDDGRLLVSTSLPPSLAEWLDPACETIPITAAVGGFVTPRRQYSAEVEAWYYSCRKCLASDGWVDPCACRCDWWSEFDVLFIGGTTAWKLGRSATWLAQQAKAKGKGVHMGRVNSRRRLHHARRIGCDSVDGTFLAWGPDKNLPRLNRWLQSLDQLELPLEVAV